MKLARRSFLTILFLSLLSLLLLAALNYWNGLRLVDQTITTRAQEELNQQIADVDKRVQQHEAEIRHLASSRPVVEFLSTQENKAEPPSSLVSSVAATLGNREGPFRLTLFRDRVLRLQGERPLDGSGASSVVVRTKDFKPQTFPADGLDSKRFSQLPNTSTWRYAEPVTSQSPAANGWLVCELDLTEVFLGRAGTEEEAEVTSSIYAAWDKNGRIIYHSQRSQVGQSIRAMMPQLAGVAQSQDSGIHSVRMSNRDFLIAYASLPQLNITSAVGHDRSAAVTSAHRWGIAGLVFAIVAAVVIAVVIEKLTRRRLSGLARIDEGLTAVAKGELDHRVELRSSDDARGMADNLNVLAERMRAQYAREAEARQFESFFRLSAMLTHDLKNSIEALSLIVGNMEHHFDNEHFRVDAMKSLQSATDKLRSLVARLSRPITSLSGEHKLPREIDLIPILGRVIKATAKPAVGQHRIDITMPEQLTATVDVERIEEVFENLIINGLEAMSEKQGVLTVTAEKGPEGKVTVTISDTGCGMSQRFIKESLFRPFRTTKQAGVGLGVYTCREVVTASGGSIEVDSAEDVGTTFRVVLPSRV